MKIIVWGYKSKERYHTHGHVHEGFYRALKFMGHDVQWLDQMDNQSGELNNRVSNTLFITEHQAIAKMPIRKDCTYAVHNYFESRPMVQERLKGMNVLHFGVFTGKPYFGNDCIWLDRWTPFYPDKKAMEMMWATDLLPEEVLANKMGAKVLNRGSNRINWVGTVWDGQFGNQREIDNFKTACKENNVAFNQFGAPYPVTVEENVALIRESIFAPAIVGEWQRTHNYIPCRIFKNISYGHFGVTNSDAVNELFGHRLICNPNTYELFYEACNRLLNKSQEQLFDLMDTVAQYHTYVNRVGNLLKAVEKL